jgi:hypothetical protein
MINLLPPFTPAANIPTGADITSTNSNLIKNTIENWISPLGSYTQQVISANTSLTELQIVNFVDASVGNIDVTLPAISSSVKTSFFFKRIDNTANTVRILASGSDKIENTFDMPSIPTATEYKLYIGNESVELVVKPLSTEWRIANSYLPVDNLGVGVYVNGNQTVNGGLKIDFNTIEYDPNANFNTTTNRFTCTVPGYYLFNFNIAWLAGTTLCEINCFKNGGMYKKCAESQSTGTGAFRQPWSGAIYLTVGDFIEFYANSATRTYYGTPVDTYLTVTYLHR